MQWKADLSWLERRRCWAPVQWEIVLGRTHGWHVRTSRASLRETWPSPRRHVVWNAHEPAEHAPQPATTTTTTMTKMTTSVTVHHHRHHHQQHLRCYAMTSHAAGLSPVVTVSTSNLNKAHVTRDRSGPPPGNECKAYDRIIMRLKRVLKFEATVRKTP